MATKEELLIEELTNLDTESRDACTVVGWMLIRALRRVSGQTDAQFVDIGQAHWDIVAGVAISLVGCRGPVESLCSLGWYSMHLAGQHLSAARDAFRFAAVRQALAGGVPDRIKAIVRGVDASLSSPYPGEGAQHVN